MTDKNEQFAKEVDCLVNAAREQQINSDDQIQNTLNQASTNFIDSKRLENLFSSAQQLQQAAELGISNLQMNIQQHRQTIQQMEKECHQQQVATDIQVVSSMQKAIAAMAQAQNSLIQSQSVNQMFDSITKCQDYLAQIEDVSTSTTTM